MGELTVTLEFDIDALNGLDENVKIGVYLAVPSMRCDAKDSILTEIPLLLDRIGSNDGNSRDFNCKIDQKYGIKYDMKNCKLKVVIDDIRILKPNPIGVEVNIMSQRIDQESFGEKE